MSRRVTSSLVVVGSGPSTGRAVAGLFAQKRYDNIALISRGRDRLEQDKAFVESMADRRVNVKTYAIDITDEQALCSTVQRIETELGRPETIFFNAARVQGSKLLETSADEVEYDLKVSRHDLNCPGLL